jgi:hypothetical protein
MRSAILEHRQARIVDSVSISRGVFKGGRHRFDGITYLQYAHDQGHLIASIRYSAVGSKEVSSTIQRGTKLTTAYAS